MAPRSFGRTANAVPAVARADDSGNRRVVLIVLPAADHPSRSSLDRLDEFVDMTISCSLFKAPPVKCRARAGGMSFQCMRVDGYAESYPLVDRRHGSLDWWDWRG